MGQLQPRDTRSAPLMCVCVCVCVRGCMCVRVCVYVDVAGRRSAHVKPSMRFKYMLPPRKKRIISVCFWKAGRKKLPNKQKIPASSSVDSTICVREKKNPAKKNYLPAPALTPLLRARDCMRPRGGTPCDQGGGTP